MISKRVSLSRDLYAAGSVSLTASGIAILFSPLNSNGAAPTTPPAPEASEIIPASTLPAIFADRIFVNNPNAGVLYVRPVIPGSAEAPEFPYANTGGVVGAGSSPAKWIGFNPAGFAAAPTAANGITVPAGAIAFPIECCCIGLVVGGTSGYTISYAAYGSAKRST